MCTFLKNYFDINLSNKVTVDVIKWVLMWFTQFHTKNH